MAITGVRVHLHNETDEPLALLSSQAEDGDWTISPPGSVNPRSVASMGTESGGFDPDTEGRATYQIGDAPSESVSLHWNDPAIGSNSFHTNTDDAHYAFWSASGGHHPEAHFTIRSAGTVMTDFRPARDGFRFSNSFGPVPYSLPPLRGTLLDNKYGNAKNGLCGGMVFAALDYFNAGWEIPQQATAPPGEQDQLFRFLVDRLFATFSLDSVSLMLALMDPLYPDGDENMLTDLGLASGRAAVMAHEEWPIIRADIDAGRPSPMFVVTVKSAWPGDLGLCHQVLAYGYDVHGHHVTIHVYDPNSPLRDDISLSFDDGDVSQRILVSHNVDVTDADDGHQLPIYCFGRMNYDRAQPPAFTAVRIPGHEVDHRGISVAVGDARTTSSSLVESGRRTYDVWPDCGEHEFGFEVFAQTQERVVTGTPHGYYDPRVAWRVGEQDVPDGADVDLTVRVVPGATSTPVDVLVHVRRRGQTLTLTNRRRTGTTPCRSTSGSWRARTPRTRGRRGPRRRR